MKPSSIKSLGAIVMAAGLGKRMRSAHAKVLHPVAGRPMVLHVVDLARRFADEGVVVVVGHQAAEVKAVLDQDAAAHVPAPQRSRARREKGLTARVAGADGRSSSLLIAEQSPQLGTGHAVMQARTALLRTRGTGAGTYLILNGDTPLLSEATIETLLQVHQTESAAITILTAVLDDPSGYGRVVRRTDDGAQVVKIVEDRDASADEAAIREINVGTYVVDGRLLFEALDELQPQNAQQEYYLTDVVALAAARGHRVAAVVVPDAREGLGINSRRQLAEAEQIMRQRLCRHWMDEGVTIRNPATTFIDADVRIGQDTVLHPHVTLEGRTTIGRDCEIRSHTRIADSVLGDRVTVQDACVIQQSRLEDETTVGPFAHLRPGTVLRRAAKVGNFVEIKKAELGEGSKANHLSYLGDARVGKHVNIGAGTITCNYDGFRKFETVIEDDVFIGSDTQLIAPVKVGRGAVVGAGSSITEEVPPDALAISRTPQIVRPGWAAKRRAWLASNEAPESSLRQSRGRRAERNKKPLPSGKTDPAGRRKKAGGR